MKTAAVDGTAKKYNDGQELPLISGTLRPVKIRFFFYKYICSGGRPDRH